MSEIAVLVLLAVASASAALSVAGLLLARGALARAHYLGPAALVAPACLAAAVAIELGPSAAAQAALAALFLILSSPAVAQLLGRTMVSGEGDSGKGAK